MKQLTFHLETGLFGRHLKNNLNKSLQGPQNSTWTHNDKVNAFMTKLEIR